MNAIAKAHFFRDRPNGFAMAEQAVAALRTLWARCLAQRPARD